MQEERQLVSCVPKHEQVTTGVHGGGRGRNGKCAFIEIHHSLNSQLATNKYFQLWQKSTVKDSTR